MSGATPSGGSHSAGAPREPSGFNALTELALDLQWSWNHDTDDIWRELDPRLWEVTRNPWALLQSASRQHIEQRLEDTTFRDKVLALLHARRRAAGEPAWFQKEHPESGLSCVAYFSMEFMLCEALPIYSGGLGNVAGDQLKAASDLGIPVIGIGLLYSQGYFRQVIDQAGAQQALHPYNDPGQLPIAPLFGADGEWVRVAVALSGRRLWLRVWQARVGRVNLYLLDSNDLANDPIDRGITGELYGGGPEQRLAQELVLGIGGWRLLAALDARPEVCHLNEGHAAFTVLERARHAMEQHGLPFAVALAATRAGNVFTTHTAVAAGFDLFAPELIEHHLGDYARLELGISTAQLLALGRADAHDATAPFNMAYLALRGSGRVNGVSQLHGQVSRQLFAPVFARWPLHEIPIGAVTNGVHMPTWESTQAARLWTQACGQQRWLENTGLLHEDVRRMTDTALWQLRNTGRKDLVDYVRQRLAAQLAAAGAAPAQVAAARALFDPGTLTLGFARRFATYKRPNLLLSDPLRLQRILTNPEQPVQLIMAGKAHPEDAPGQALIQQWVRFARQPALRSQVIFLADYDMRLAAHLVQGVDVWINTPRRPWEACGTSGMKILVNGGLNLSELDGWWAEAYSPAVGWALGDGQEHAADQQRDAAEAEQLYMLLEQQVIPEFYGREPANDPTAWIGRIRESIAQLTPHFSSNRSVREYTEEHYLPAAAAFHTRSADHCAIGRQLVAWQQTLMERWSHCRIGAPRVETRGDRTRIEVEIHLAGIDPGFVRVELYAEARGDEAPARIEMSVVDAPVRAPDHVLYRASVPAARSPGEYTARVVPRRSGAAIPLEAPQILWQR